METGNAAQQMCELQLKLLAAQMAKNGMVMQPMDYEAIRARFAKDAAAFFNVLKRAEDEIRAV